MILQALIALIMVIFAIALTCAFLPLLGTGLAALGSLVVGTAARVSEYVSTRRASQAPKTPAVESGSTSRK